MVTVESQKSLITVWSFSLLVPKEATLEGLKHGRIFARHSFSTCSGYSRTADPTSKYIVQFPLEYVHEKFRNEEFFKTWEKEMKAMGSTVNYLGIHSCLIFTDSVKKHNKHVIETFQNADGPLLIKKDEWVTWEIYLADSGVLKTYHDFCLLRYLWAGHYTRIIDVYFDIKSRLTKTKPRPLEMLQMAHYSYDPSQGRYSGHYCHVACRANAFKLVPHDEVLAFILNKEKGTLNNAFSDETKFTYEQIYELIIKRRYKQVYDQLKG